MTLQARTQALLDLVESDRERQCQALLGQARAQAATLLAQARAAARARAHHAFAAERERAAGVLAAAQAELATRKRLHAQRRMEALLARAWVRLPELLRQRWAAPPSRVRWVERALRDAERLFGDSGGPTGWTMQHALPWPEAERAVLTGRLHAPRFVADARLGAGLRIVAGGNVVDATLEGLLADRDEIGGRIVGLLEAGAP